LIIICLFGFHQNLFLGNDHLLASFFLNGLIFFGLMIIKDFLDLCWIRTLISEHVFNLDIDNYLVDETYVSKIRHDISEVRKIQIEHAVDVDTKDPNIRILFEEEFSEERITEFERNRLRKLATSNMDDEEKQIVHQKPRPKAEILNPSSNKPALELTPAQLCESGPSPSH
jgi:hypothetical protein